MINILHDDDSTEVHTIILNMMMMIIIIDNLKKKKSTSTMTDGRKFKLSNLHTNGNNELDNYYCTLEHWLKTTDKVGYPKVCITWRNE